MVESYITTCTLECNDPKLGKYKLCIQNREGYHWAADSVEVSCLVKPSYSKSPKSPQDRIPVRGLR